ncbi:hypothetical protein [Actinoplanes aureus]|uniref:Uncharacterized protein n=1 Tax=Actinoplanes aureus TaxID=2792083 RepID=A0A931CEP6_9ACTN|nr:hypothetical protein [Actinoplanes aureus]MBG0565808.1 hypothetical protein [Actinoplanes aureus]
MDCGGYVREKVSYLVGEGERVSAYLSIPANLVDRWRCGRGVQAEFVVPGFAAAHDFGEAALLISATDSDKWCRGAGFAEMRRRAYAFLEHRLY